MKANKKTVIIIAGPTAVGKTGMAITIAKHFGTEIISADSRQCYKELNIGVARPSTTELAAVPHWFIASHSIHQTVTAATFEQYALEKAALLFVTHNLVVITGGTGLYIKAFCDGLDPIPNVPAHIRNQVIQQYEQSGITGLQNEIKNTDPLFYETGEINNPQRLQRALEVMLATGQSIFSYRTAAKAARDFNMLKIGLNLPKEVLHERINHRVDVMMQQGLMEEVRELRSYQKLNALQTVGYKELFEYFEGTLTLQQAIEKIKTATRQYAKRQLTWFRKDAAIHWLPPVEEQILQFIKQHLNG